MTGRWPATECLHERTAGQEHINNWIGQLVRIVPERCLDCKARRDPNTDEWITR